ncbi:TIGR03087 family PEP-CTERM/XrtA system glycosyltransferase [Paraglaciecola sp.]|uniref:TIGR03087 family PEP-CTERM/XrtA system glycosyltransferase n=1 Tax=Paraglaciecola sp. TaxID=1920173 RepID=UPI0030F39467
MNILIISQRCPFPPNKGEKIRTFHHLKFLTEQGHNVFLASPYEHDSELPFFATLAEHYCQQISYSRLPHKILRLLRGLLTGKALSIANFYHSTLQKKIDKQLLENSIDVIYCSASSVAEYVFNSEVIQQLIKKPRLVMDFMDVDSDKWSQYAQQTSWPLKYIYQRETTLIACFEKKIANSFEHCILITQAEVDLFKQIHGSQFAIHAIENGLDTSTFYPPPSSRERQSPRLLFAGVMDYAPNVDAVMWFINQVWPSVIEKWPQATFCIAGMDPVDKIKKLHGLSGIEITGFVEDIKPYFDNANIFVAPFRLARGVQNKVLQAFACGLPVIATPMGAEGVKCRDKQDILTASTPAEFIDCLNILMTDENKYIEISRNALTIIEDHYAWDSVLAPLQKLVTQE